jgi:5'-nucleotidase
MKILYIDMDNVLVDFLSAFPHVPEEVLKQYEGRLDEVPGIFGLMDPIDGAIDAYHELAALFDTYILSTSPWENPSADSGILIRVLPCFWCKQNFLLFIIDEYSATVC